MNTIDNNNSRILEQGGNCSPWSVTGDECKTAVSSFNVFPCVQLNFYNIHTEHENLDSTATGNFLEISHCREGRMEREYGNEFFYLSSGDLSITKNSGLKCTAYFPLHHYLGVSILVDLDRTPNCMSCILEDVNVTISELLDKYCGNTGCYIARSKPYIEHIFSELYDVPKSIQKGYFKVKILELLLYLSGIEAENGYVRHRAGSKEQKALARQICQHLTSHMDERITLSQLADLFHVSGTTIKTAFKEVYGISVYSYIRTQKMESAAILLRDTDKSVLDIALSCGYNNGSKFSNAFKTVMGATPIEYRNARV